LNNFRGVAGETSNLIETYGEVLGLKLFGQNSDLLKGRNLAGAGILSAEQRKG
jgi:hypothetical protein